MTLRQVIDAGDAFVCGLIVARLPRASGAAFRRILKVLELGVKRGNSAAISALARHLAATRRTKEARALMRKLSSVPVRVRVWIAEMEYEVRREVMGKRSAIHLGRMAARRGIMIESFKNDLREHDPESALAFEVMERFKLACWW
jgi:hypothetical protein